MFGAVLVVLTHGRGRVNGLAFAVGFIAGQTACFLLAFFLGDFSIPRGNHPTAIAGFLIVLGIALLVVAVYVRRHHKEPVRVRAPNPRMGELTARLGRLGPLSALGVGTLLGIGGPKRIAVTIVAASAIAAAGLSLPVAGGLAIVYVVVATSLVWVPVGLYVGWGPQAADWLLSAQNWIGRHRKPLIFYPSVLIGLALVIDGVLQLAT